jgi:serine/threonine-protein kinase
MTPQQTIAHYKIVAKIGDGGIGAVYHATDAKLNRDVAIKCCAIASRRIQVG